MKTVTGKVVSAEPISLSKAAKLLAGFASSDNGASQDVSVYLRRASTAFNELKNIHRDIKSKETKPSSDASRERNPTGEFDGGKILFRESETVSVKKSIYSGEQEEIKEDKKKKKKSKKNKEVVDEKVNEKLENEQRSQERKEKKKRRKSDEEIGSEERERKSKKKRKLKEIDG